ncbi:MAG: thiolase domain-containing protein [Candidatus Hodarchaeota archaeon]
MTSKVAIVSAYSTRFGELWEAGVRELAEEVTNGVLTATDKTIEPKSIDAIYVGNMASGGFTGQEHISAVVADAAGLHDVPNLRIEGACASGGLGLRTAYMAVRGGIYETVMVVGIEKMTDQTQTGKVQETMSSSMDVEWEAQLGLTFAGAFAMMARSHFREYGTTRRHLAAVSCKNHAHGALNPRAHFQRKFDIDTILKFPFVAEPLSVMDTAPVSDGAAAIILTRKENARKFTDAPVWITGSGQGSDSLSLHGRESLTSLKATRMAGREAMRQAGITPDQINLAEIHDSFTINEIMALEDLGFFIPGKAGPATLEGQTSINSKYSINTSGGLKAGGNPLGAVGIAQAVEVFIQLRNSAGNGRQVDNAEIALTHNIGGSGATCVVHTYSNSN